MSSRKKIILHGYLKDLEPRALEFDVDTVAEALTALCRQCPGFHAKMGRDKPRIRVLGFDAQSSWDIPTDVEELHVFPDFSGRKRGGIFRIILGVVLVATSFIPGIAGTPLGSFLISAGAGLVLGGIIDTLFPAPRSDSSDTTASRYLGAPGNTTKIGTRIPLLYGRKKVFGHILSFDIQAKDVVT